MLSWLAHSDPFPPLEKAFSEPNGLLCAGGDLSPQRLIEAYRLGIFPWYAKGEPILWWSPDPRMVLFPAEIRISRSLRKILRQAPFQITLDSCFVDVIHACASTPRSGQPGTWITTEMQQAYTRLFQHGFTHSVEVWADTQLVGGLYGVALGKVFYGESMFSRQPNASKIALAHLARFLAERGFGLIDCQMSTPHLASMGGREIPRQEFVRRLQKWADMLPLNSRWPREGAAYRWESGGLDAT